MKRTQPPSVSKGRVTIISAISAAVVYVLCHAMNLGFCDSVSGLM